MNQPLEEVIPIHRHLQPLFQHQINALHTLPKHLRALRPPEELNDPVQSHVTQRRHRRQAPQAAQDILQPRMVTILIQRSERHTKDQVTGDIKSHAIIPRRCIQGHLPLRSLLMKLVNQQVDILSDQRPLSAHRRVRKAVGQSPTQLPVLFAPGADDVYGLVVDGADEGLELGHLLLAMTAAGDVAEDVAPGTHIGEGEVIGCNSHNRTVFVVESLRVEGLYTEAMADTEGDGGGALQERTWV